VAATPTPAAQASGLYEGAKVLYQTKRYREAKVQLDKCLELDKTSADCESLLGSCYAKLGDNEKGADHYRRFIVLAPPGDKRIPRVKELLDQYEQNRLKNK
jgi:Tfp pilus assembly protein PilF